MIRQTEALNIGNDLLRQYGLDKDGWLIQFNKSSRYLGQCFYQARVITISVHMLSGSSEAELRDTLLHEIAHALVGPHVEPHGLEWQAKAREIGAIDRTCSKTLNMNEGRGLSEAEAKPRIHIKPLEKKCPQCGKTAIEQSRAIFGDKTFIRLECGHLTSQENLKGSSFEDWISTTKNFKLFPYQVEGAKFIVQAHGRALIADEPALGKTVQATSFLHFYSDIACPAIWVGKSKLSIQILKEHFEWRGKLPYIINSARSFIMPGQDVYIISMDLLRRIPSEKLLSIGAKTLVFDEVQHIKNPDSARTQEVRRLVAGMDFVIFLSGTPWKNRGSEYFSALNMLRPDLFPSYKKFTNDWVDWYEDKKTGKWKEGGIKDIPKFKEYTKGFVIRRMREDVLPDLPKINRQLRYVELENIYGDAYEKAEGQVAAIIKDLVLDGKARQAGAKIQSEIMKLKHITGLAKVDAQVEDAIEFLEETEDWQKLTIFHHHIDVGDNLQAKLDKWLTENGYNKSLRILGGMDAMDSNKIQEKFKTDIKNRVLIASTLASGEGFNFQFCQNASMMERQWNPANEEQAELRFSRPLNAADLPEYLKHLADANKVSIRIPYLICAGTVDELLTEIVERKRFNFRKVMNDKDLELKWNEMEMINELAEAIMRKRYGNKTQGTLLEV